MIESVPYAEKFKDFPYYEDISLGDHRVIRRTKAAMFCGCGFLTEWYVRDRNGRGYDLPACSRRCARKKFQCP